MRKETPFRLENVGEHFPVKGVGSNHTYQICREKRRRFMANSPDVPKAQVPLKLTKKHSNVKSVMFICAF